MRTRAIGHFFPAGTVDAFDVWLELQARDATGRVIYWSGKVEDGGRGPVERGAHFYKSFQIDAEGNPINKRNAWQARSTLYVRLIPPGAADVAHFRMRIPPGREGPHHADGPAEPPQVHALLHRVRVCRECRGRGRSVPAFDNREWTFEKANVPANVSGKIKGEIPDLPITVLARAEARLELGDAKTPAAWQPVVRREDRERWNDWGIGLLLQGDLKGAEYAFQKVTEAEPGYADGWLNVARALVQEGETDAAKPYIARALADQSDAWAASTTSRRWSGRPTAITTARSRRCGTAAAQYPRDRVVLDQIGAHSVPEARLRGGGARARRCAGGGPGGFAGALQPDAGAARPGRPRGCRPGRRRCSSASRPTRPRRL